MRMVMCYVVYHIADNCIHVQMNGIVCVILMSFLASTSVFTLLSHGRFASASFFCVFVYFGYREFYVQLICMKSSSLVLA